MRGIVTCEIKGLDQLQKKLEELPVAVADSILKEKLKEAGQVIAESIAAHVPHAHPEFDTGLLARSINVKVKIMNGALAAMAYIGPAVGVDYPRGPRKSKKAKK